MIVRTYQRRNRALARSLTDPGLCYGDIGTDSCSQDTPWSSSQERLSCSFPSSQDSSSLSQIENGTVGFQTSNAIKGLGVQGHRETINDVPNASIKNPRFENAKRKHSERSSPGQMLRRAHTSITSGHSGDVTTSSQGCLPANEERKFCKSRSGLSGIGCVTSSTAGKQEYESSVRNTSVWGPFAPPTSTLMEVQESGEMMENVDETNFAIDGLRPEQPMRIQRASLVSLLSICGSTQRRRLLRTHGMAKPVLDAVVCLPTDDPPTALGAAALVYMLASDGQDENLLDSSICIEFLMKLLNPCSVPRGNKKLSFGSQLSRLSTKQSVHNANIGCAGIDRGGSAVVAKVLSLLESTKGGSVSNCKQDEQNGQSLREEPSSQSLALLTLEKACLSTVILDDNSGSVRRVGGHFKESLRELGGLDAICDLAASCYLKLKGTLGDKLNGSSLRGRKKPLSINALNGVGMLQRCLKVMENVTFLSEANQKHLLDMMMCNEKKDFPDSFIGLIIDIIKILSELVAIRRSWPNIVYGERDGKQTGNTAVMHAKIKVEKSLSKGFSELRNKELHASIDVKDDRDLDSKKAKEWLNSGGCNTAVSETKHQRWKTVKQSALEKRAYSNHSFEICESGDTQRITLEQSTAHQGRCGLRIPKDSPLLEEAVGTVSQIDSSCMEEEEEVYADFGERHRVFNEMANESSKMQFCGRNNKMLNLREQKVLEDSQDPFEFDDVDLNLAQGFLKKPHKRRRGRVVLKTELIDDSSRLNTLLANGHDPGTKDTCNESQESQESFNEHIQQCLLLGDCLLSTVKVLMNLTNDNPVGCCQVAACGGLDALVFILTGHYAVPQFKLPFSHDPTSRHGGSQDGPIKDFDGRQAEQDLELLVVVLGVLVNLVEKDNENRALLAALDVDVPSTLITGDAARTRKGVIGLLCSIFLSKEGTVAVSDGTAGKHVVEIDVEASIRQGQREAENTIVEAYAALLLAFLSTQSVAARSAIAAHLPGDGLKALVPVLERFVAFHLSLNMISSETHTVVRDVIESCKRPL